MIIWILTNAAFSLAILPSDALAYIGPGAGLAAIGSLVALVSALFLAIVGFIWYPVKHLLRRRKMTGTEEEKATAKTGKT